VHEDTHIDEFLKVLLENHILAAPVYRNPTTVHGKVLVGMVSSHDVMLYAFEQRIFDTEIQLGQTVDENRMKAIINNQFFNTPLSRVIDQVNLRKKNVIVSSRDTVKYLLSLFTDGGYHRVLVHDTEVLVESPAGLAPLVEKLSIVTQTDLCKYLMDMHLTNQDAYLPMLTTLFDASVMEITKLALAKKYNHPTGRVVAVNEYQPIIEAFHIMSINNLHALPALDDKGRVASTIAASDIRFFDLLNINTLAAPASSFAKKNVTAAQLAVHSEVSVEIAVEKMLSNHAHHVWVIDDNGVINGVITWTDVLTLFYVH